jgi:hypothetical protein
LTLCHIHTNIEESSLETTSRIARKGKQDPGSDLVWTRRETRLIYYWGVHSRGYRYKGLVDENSTDYGGGAMLLVGGKGGTSSKQTSTGPFNPCFGSDRARGPIPHQETRLLTTRPAVKLVKPSEQISSLNNQHTGRASPIPG